MRHEGPFRYDKNGPWHYASVSRRGSHPIGYCTYDCTHATAEEAHEHYRQWVLDHLVEEAYRNTKYVCAVKDCEEWTQFGLGNPDGYGGEALCDKHRNREAFEANFYPPDSPVRESWGS